MGTAIELLIQLGYFLGSAQRAYRSLFKMITIIDEALNITDGVEQICTLDELD